MRRWSAGFGFLLLLTLSAPMSVQAGMGLEEAKHLLLRTEFGAAPARVAEFARLDRTQAVDRLLAETATEAGLPVPGWVGEPPQRLRRPKDLSEQERRMNMREQLEKGMELRAWWLGEMLHTRSPLTERMTLFWHNHFVSAQQKVKLAQLMARQNQLLRREALGNFGQLLNDVAHDPAMVIYLDSAQNRKDAPNENFAREVMELFTMGQGSGYTERDVKEAARAFTGWSIDRGSGEFRFIRAQHDDGTKTVLGRSGALAGEDVLNILLDQPATAEFITAKLWKEFVSPNPDRTEVKRLAENFRNSRYAIKPLMRALLLSDGFWAKKHRGVLIKSPLEFLVGTVKAFEISGVDARVLALSARQLGQDVFAPPNVKGWPGGEQWINANALLTRNQIVERLFRGEEMAATPMQDNVEKGRARRMERFMNTHMENIRFDSHRWLDELPGDEGAKRSLFVQSTFAVQTVDAMPDVRSARLDFARALAIDPAWHVK